MNFKNYFLLLSLFAFSTSIKAQDTDSLALDSAVMEELINYYREAYRLDSLLSYQHGEISLGDELATVNIGDDYKYLNPTETKKILEEAWGNPPQETLGMIFPDSVNPYLGDGWGVILSYDEEGYIEDDDAAEIDYEELLTSMKEEAIESSKMRREQGYAGYEIVGWAENPYYDSETKKLYWAKELAFDEGETNTLNYDIRVLGRKGYLRLNAVSGIDQLEVVKPSMQVLLSRVEFNQGNTYFDFDPSVDKVATYGIGALIAGKLAAKAGLLKVIGIFLAKFWKFLLIGGAAVVTFVKRVWFGKEKREIS